MHRRGPGRTWAPLIIGAVLFCVVLAVALRGVETLEAARAASRSLLLYAFFSPLSFIAYYLDKRAAQWGGRRTPERQMIAMDVLGGWPGGLIAQELFRHKTVKSSYQAGFWFAVLANVAAMVWWLEGMPLPR